MTCGRQVIANERSGDGDVCPENAISNGGGRVAGILQSVQLEMALCGTDFGLPCRPGTQLSRGWRRVQL